jgi:uncharacterized membrane protein
MKQEYRLWPGNNKDATLAPRAAAARHPSMTGSSPNRAAMLVLAYLWPLAIVPLVLDRDDAEVQWHARHGLVLMAAEILVLFGASVVMSLATMLAFSFGCALSFFVILLWVVILAVHLAAIVRALNGARLIVPGVSDFADRFEF